MEIFVSHLSEERSKNNDEVALNNIYVSLQKNLINSFQKIKQRNFKCLESNCNENAIKSHIISKSSHLKKLLGETEESTHVIGVKNNWNKNNDSEKISFVSVKNHQATMPCFCETHDKNFYEIDDLKKQNELSLNKYFNLAAYRVIAAEIQMEEIYIRLYNDLNVRKMLFLKNLIEMMNIYGCNQVSQDFNTLFKDNCISSLEIHTDFHKKRKKQLTDYLKIQKSIMENNCICEVECGSIFVEFDKPEIFIHSVAKESKVCSWVTMTSLMYKDENDLEKNGILFNYISPKGGGGSSFVKEIYKRLFFSKHDFSILASTFLNTSQKSFLYLSRNWYENLPKDHKEVIIDLISLKDDMENYVENFRKIFSLCQEKKGFGVRVVNRKVLGDMEILDNIIKKMENLNEIPSEDDCSKFDGNDYKLILLNVFLSKILYSEKKTGGCQWIECLNILIEKKYFSFSQAEFIFIYEYMSKFSDKDDDFTNRVTRLFGFENNLDALSYIRLK